MPHRYIDTSDLNAPYEQLRAARPLQGLGAAEHLYMDYSNLNAQWDRSRPAIHGLGGGSLGGSSLGNTMSANTGVGLASIDEECPAVSSAHGRMYQSISAMPGDEELMAQFERNTSQYGCPVRGESHWFWPNAPTMSWNARGPTDPFVKSDWDRISPSSTLFIPPFLQDMGNPYTASVRDRTTVVLPETTIEEQVPETFPEDEYLVPAKPATGAGWNIGLIGGTIVVSAAVAAVVIGGAYFYKRSA